MRSRILKACLLIVLVSLCVGVPIVILFRRTSLPETGNTEDDMTSSWTTIPARAILIDVFMVSADDGWAVGECDVWNKARDKYENIIHWNGTCWNRVASPIVCMLSSVFMVSADDGWAVGESWVSKDWGWAGGPGVIIRWNGTSWNNVTSPTTSWLSSVFMVSADDGWIVNDTGTIILRWTGTEWIPEFSAAILMLLLMCLTLVAVIVEKTALRKSRRPQLPSESQI